MLSNVASILFLGLFLSIIVTSVLELRWSGIGIEDWWHNERFWVIGGVSAHQVWMPECLNVSAFISLGRAQILNILLLFVVLRILVENIPNAKILLLWFKRFVVVILLENKL